MKYIVLIIGLLVVGCGKQEQADTNESTPTTNTNEVDGATAKPVKELTLREKVVGEYEYKNKEGVWRMVLLENGLVEGYETLSGTQVEVKQGQGETGRWKISKGGEIHDIWNDGFISVLRINKDGSITNIATIDKDGKRKDMPKEYQRTFKKIK